MRRSIRGAGRAGLWTTGGVAAATLLLSGCGSGQVAETAAQAPAIAGVNVQTDDDSFKVRNLAIGYPGVEGYPSGGNAPLTGALYNDSTDPITVTVRATGVQSVALRSGTSASNPPGAGQITPGPAGSASVSPGPAQSTGAPSSPDSGGIASGSPVAPGNSPAGERPASPSASATPDAATPSAAPAGPARVEIPAGGFVLLSQAAGSYLELVGLNEDLKPGQSIEVTFEVDGAELTTPVPVAIPLTPAPTVKITTDAEEGGHG
ncbi:hypothetical protein [Plantactinospora sp. GCM10030261]|uniref:hypothetical protein n=1 Tax=Plantactinospora sp. GCM10030261 TaxID=3273420 RepID=UPI00360E67E7